MRPSINVPFALLLTLCLGGCVSTQQYPEQWAQGFPEMPVKAGDKCDLTGAYADVGEPAPGQKNSVPVSLFNLLFSGTQFSAANTADRVSLSGPVAGELTVVAWKDGKVVETRRSKSLSCLQNGQVMVNPGTEAWHGGLAITFGAGNQDNLLYRGSDGWLILKRNDLAVVIPWFKYETSWYRFQPLNSAQ